METTASPMASTKQPTSTKTTNKNKSAKTTKPKPSSTTKSKKNKLPNPYSPYTIYFRLERLYILQSLCNSPPPASYDPTHHDPAEHPRPSKYASIKMPPYWYSSTQRACDEKRRKHRKVVGVVTMSKEELTALISKSWRDVDEETLRYVKMLSDVEKRRRMDEAAAAPSVSVIDRALLTRHNDEVVKTSPVQTATFHASRAAAPSGTMTNMACHPIFKPEIVQIPPFLHKDRLQPSVQSINPSAWPLQFSTRQPIPFTIGHHPANTWTNLKPPTSAGSRGAKPGFKPCTLEKTPEKERRVPFKKRPIEFIFDDDCQVSKPAKSPSMHLQDGADCFAANVLHLIRHGSDASSSSGSASTASNRNQVCCANTLSGDGDRQYEYFEF